MASAKIRTLSVRPIQSTDLAFEISGVLARQNATRARLGQRLIAFDSTAMTALFRQDDPRRPERLIADAVKIGTTLKDSYLFGLRNENLGVELEQAIAHREIAFLQRYQHTTAIAADLRALYDKNVAASKLKRLETLQQNAAKLRQELDAEYRTRSRQGVTRSTESRTTTAGPTISITELTPVTMKNTKHEINVSNPASKHTVDETQTIPQVHNGAAWVDLVRSEVGFKSQLVTTTSDSMTQVTSTQGHEFRHPSLENIVADQREQLDLQDEILAHRTFAHRIDRIEDIMKRELDVIDLQVAELQMRYAQTFLTSPIPGIITAIYKDLGEYVQAGEPVMRVENDERVLIVGIVIYRGHLRVDQPVTVRTDNAFESTSPVSVNGTIVAVRGHEADDDEWDIIIEVDNKTRTLPLNYQFDRNTSRIDIL